MNNAKMPTHLFRYRFQGKEYAFDIPAASPAEAKERLKAIAWAQYDGELVASVPVELGLFARIAVALQNAVGARSVR